MKKNYLPAFTLIFLFMVTSGFALDFNYYGYIRLNTAYDTNNSSHGQLILFVPQAEKDGRTSFTANFSRFGFTVSQKVNDWNILGLIELDFLGGGVTNKANPRMRHAFLKLEKDNSTFIVGQTWDIVSPLNPKILKFVPLWATGNVGFRSAQIRYSHKFTFENGNFDIAAGLFQTVATDMDLDGIDDGERGGLPTFQARAGVNLKTNGIDFSLGIAGLYGQAKTMINNAEKNFSSQGLFLDLTLKSGKFKLLSEYFTGQNLGAYWGGIMQRVNLARETEIKARGGFVNLIYSASKKVDFSAGFGIDKPDKETLSPGNKSLNKALFANVVCNLISSFYAGVEIEFWETEYFETSSRKNTRIVLDFIYKFK